MEYEKTILTLMEKVASLEERVSALEGKEKEAPKMPRGYYTDIVKKQIHRDISEARKSGKNRITLTAGDIQREVGLKNRLPLVCNAMRDCMDARSVIEHETPSGQSSTFSVTWNW